MIFVIGSAYQGKTEFVIDHFKIKEQDILNGESCDYKDLYKAKVINHFERLIYRLMNEGQSVTPFVLDLLEINKEVIIISAEIGSGLVPVDSFDRNYRETAGRIGCQIVKHADQVYRVQCGIAAKIYEKQDIAFKEQNKRLRIIKVYLLRHSVTKGNLEKRFIGSTDEHLCEEGIELAKSKKLPKVDKVYTSPLNRCKETSDILYLNQVKVIIPGLRETDFGDFEYKNYEELNGNPDYQRWIDSNATSGFPNGESFEDANQRAKDTFCQIIKDAVKNQYNSIAIVTHGGTIMAIMHQFSKEKKEYFEWMAKNCEGYLLEIDGGSVCYR